MKIKTGRRGVVQKRSFFKMYLLSLSLQTKNAPLSHSRESLLSRPLSLSPLVGSGVVCVGPLSLSLSISLALQKLRWCLRGEGGGGGRGAPPKHQIARAPALLRALGGGDRGGVQCGVVVCFTWGNKKKSAVSQLVSHRSLSSLAQRYVFEESNVWGMVQRGVVKNGRSCVWWWCGGNKKIVKKI